LAPDIERLFEVKAVFVPVNESRPQLKFLEGSDRSLVIDHVAGRDGNPPVTHCQIPKLGAKNQVPSSQTHKQRVAMSKHTADVRIDERYRSEGQTPLPVDRRRRADQASQNY
jgi:hypothetical protein